AGAGATELLCQPECIGFRLKPGDPDDRKERVVPLTVVPPVRVVMLLRGTALQPVLQPVWRFAVIGARTPGPARIAPIFPALIASSLDKAGKLAIGDRIFAHPHVRIGHRAEGIRPGWCVARRR